MRIFVTGATGFVGSAVVAELIAAGHEVTGLARTQNGEASLAAAGAKAHRGSLDDLNSLRRGAAAADSVIHTAFDHDFSRFKENCENDRRVIEAFGEVLSGSDRPLIVTSAIGILPSGKFLTEDTMPASGPAAHPRAATEQASDAVVAQGACVSIVRLPPSVHGDGDHGFVPHLFGLARQSSRSVHVGDGFNRWPAVHRLDAARLYRLILESNLAGARYHAVAEQGIAFRDIAAVIAKRLDVPVESKSPEDAANHFGWFAHFAAMDVTSSSQHTRQALGWEPQQPGLLADLDRPSYFGS